MFTHFKLAFSIIYTCNNNFKILQQGRSKQFEGSVARVYIAYYMHKYTAGTGVWGNASPEKFCEINRSEVASQMIFGPNMPC